MRKILLPLILALPMALSSIAKADQFLPAVANPFAFCEAPRPCNKCPLHAEWDQLCPNNKADGQRATANLEAQQQIKAQNANQMYSQEAQIVRQSPTPMSIPQQQQTSSSGSGALGLVGAGGSGGNALSLVGAGGSGGNALSLVGAGNGKATNTLDLLK